MSLDEKGCAVASARDGTLEHETGFAPAFRGVVVSVVLRFVVH